ncbi:MAG: hypothetical protein ABIG66_01220 [Candidatus Kerfeldbacteria bacterium]
MRQLIAFALLLMQASLGCGPATLNPCDQDSWYFPCEIGQANGLVCDQVDIDDDGVPATYDRDDYDPAVYEVFECSGTDAMGNPELVWDDYCQLYWNDICELRCGYEAQYYDEGLYDHEEDNKAYERYCLN